MRALPGSSTLARARLHAPCALEAMYGTSAHARLGWEGWQCHGCEVLQLGLLRGRSSLLSMLCMETRYCFCKALPLIGAHAHMG